MVIRDQVGFFLCRFAPQQETDFEFLLLTKLLNHSIGKFFPALTAMRVGLTEDIYLSLTRIDGGGITLDLFRNPMMWLLWVGGFVVVAGAAWPLIAGSRSREREQGELIRA